MVFKDYYQILEIEQSSTISEIKSAFKKQAIKWHPDKNIGMNTTLRMQDINEAYLMLKHLEARKRYDLEYQNFKSFTAKKESAFNQKETYKESYRTENQNQTESQPEYEFDDEILKNWVRNARKQAVDLAIQTIKEMGELSITASKAAGAKMLEWIFGYVVGGVILFILFKTCSSI